MDSFPRASTEQREYTRPAVAARRAGRPRRDPEDRVIDEGDEVQRREKAMDKTLADSFPASDPPGWLP